MVITEPAVPRAGIRPGFETVSFQRAAHAQLRILLDFIIYGDSLSNQSYGLVFGLLIIKQKRFSL